MTTGEDDEAEPNLDVEDELDPSVKASDNAVVDDVAAEVNEDSLGLPPLSRADLNLGRFAITKVSANNYISQLVQLMPFGLQLCNLAKRIVNSPTIRADLEIACNKSSTKPMLMVRDVATRWNSTAELLARALQLRKALTMLVGFEQHNRARSSRLQRFKLSSDEWQLIEQLQPLLQVS